MLRVEPVEGVGGYELEPVWRGQQSREKHQVLRRGLLARLALDQHPGFPVAQHQEVHLALFLGTHETELPFALGRVRPVITGLEEMKGDLVLETLALELVRNPQRVEQIQLGLCSESTRQSGRVRPDREGVVEKIEDSEPASYGGIGLSDVFP